MLKWFAKRWGFVRGVQLALTGLPRPEQKDRMTLKMLKGWEDEFIKACGLAYSYNCKLTVDQFCASRGLETEDRDALLEHLAKHSVSG